MLFLFLLLLTQSLAVAFHWYVCIYLVTLSAVALVYGLGTLAVCLEAKRKNKASAQFEGVVLGKEHHQGAN